MKDRIEYIDNAKGILIILVVIGHIFSYGYVHNVIYAFHMAAFFIISGMFLESSIQRPLVLNIKNRIRTLIIPLIFFEILGSFIAILGSDTIRRLKVSL